MKRKNIFKLLILVTFISCTINRNTMTQPVSNDEWYRSDSIWSEFIQTMQNQTPKFELIYDDVIGTYYNAVPEQTNSQPTLTGSGYVINPDSASELRWIAISQTMLNCEYRASLANDNRFNGSVSYGDTVWIESPYDEINGWWVVRDAMNKRYSNRIDFLQTLGDSTLWWRGKYDNIKIFKVENKGYLELMS